MSALREATVFDEYERPVPGAVVYVTNSAGFNAVLASDVSGMALIAQPITTDEFGVYRYYAADGFYREDIWYGGRLRYSSAGVPVGDTVGLLPEAVFRSEAARDGAEAAEASVLASLGGAAFSSLILSAADRTILAALDHSTGLPAILTETYRAGIFKWIGTNQSAGVTSDPEQGVYVPPLSDPTGASGTWVRQYDGALNPKWFGASGDDIMDDSTAFLAAIAFSYAHAQGGYGFGSAGSPIKVPLGKYYLGAQTLDFVCSTILEGDGTGGAGGGASVLRWDADTTGLRFQRSDTSGASTQGATGTPGADGSIVRGLLLKGGYAGVEGEYHAVHIRCHGVTVEQNQIEDWQGDGIHNHAGSDADGGNANCFSFHRNLIRRCRDGISTKGDNSNAGSGFDNDVSDNRRWGIDDRSFLGSTWQGIAENCGLTAGFPSIVSYGGNRYAVVAGQEAGAATNPPTGAATDNAWWYYVSAGAPDAVRPAWVNGITVRAGGPIRTDNNNARSVIVGFYSEPGQGPSQLVWPTLVLGGQHGAGVKGVSWLRHGDQGLQTDVLHVLNNAIFGPTLGFATSDGATFFDTTDTLHQLLFRYFVAGNAFYSGVIQSEVGQGMRIYGDPEIQLFAGSPAANTHIGTIDPDGLHIGPLGAGAAVFVGPDKVLGSQQPAIVDAAGGSTVDTEARIALGQVIAAMRAHGLIDT